MRTSRLPLLLGCVIGALLLGACGAAISNEPAPAIESEAREDAGGAVGAAAPPALYDAAPGSSAGDSTSNAPAAVVVRLVIKQAQLGLIVDDVLSAEAQVQALATRLGGYVVSSTLSGSGEYTTSTVTLRVPAERFDEALQGVEGLARSIESRSVSGEDVTEEYVDLESRTRSLEATYERLLGFLERAETVEEALEVNLALTDIQSQIEVLRGRMQYLQQSAALSTISVTLSPQPVTPILSEEAWRPDEIARRALRGLIEFGQGLLGVLIVFAIWSPVWLPIVGLSYWGLRRVFRRPVTAAAAGNPPPTPPTPPTPQP